MTEQAQVVIIGGGVVGCSCLYHLTALGWSDVVLLERNELTAGSTWHAAGNCPTFSTTLSVLRLQQYSGALYRRLGAEADYPINYHVTGSLRLAHTAERMDEYRHIAATARALGLEYEILAPEQIPERHPLVDPAGLRGALWDPLDGDIDPAQLTQALAAAARRRGARIRRFTRVTGLACRPGGGWEVRTDRGSDYRAQIVVNAAGYRAPEVMALLGHSLPAVTLAHQYLVTDELPELAARTTRVPLLRDPDVSYYLRQERAGLILGPYEHRASPQWLDGIPDEFSYRLFADDLERAGPYITAACERIPALARAGIKRVVNGPIPYSPDGLPYIGPAYGLRDFFHCNTFSFGIAQAGGAGKALAEWIINGAPEWDLWSCDPRRFGSYATPAYTLAKAVDVYENEYAVAFPYEERAAGRPLRTSPLHQRLAACGAQFGARGGWERALWYASAATGEPERLSFRRTQCWRPFVAGEVRAVRTNVALMDLPGFTKYLVSGPGAARCLEQLLCSRLPRVGRCALGYALNPAGHILSEFTVTRLGEQRFYLVSAAAAARHDADLLLQGLPADGSVTLEELTNKVGTLVLAGPRAREVLSKTTAVSLQSTEFPYLAARSVEVAGAAVWLLRISYTGELAWEIHAPLAALSAIYGALHEAGAAAGLRPFGLLALDSLRIDKGYRGWKVDFDAAVSPLAAGLERFVDFTRQNYPGAEAVHAERARGPEQRLVPLLLEEPTPADAPAASPVLAAPGVVGLVTSAAWSFTLNRSVALAYVQSRWAAVGTALQVQILGERCGAVVAREPPYDPLNERLRA